MAEWRDVILRDICDSVDYGFTASASNEEVGPKFLRITDIVQPILAWPSVPFVKVSPDQARKYRLHSGDIVIARTGATTGCSAWISNPPEAVFASYLIRLKISQANNSRFVSYLLKSDQFWSYVKGVLGDKSAQPNASATTLTNAPLRIPSRRVEQEAIAAVLGTLDDKIAVNDRIAEAARALARARFRSEQEAGHTDDIELGSAVEFLNRGVAPRYTEDQSQLRVLNQKCVRGGRVSLGPSRRTLADKVSAQKLLKPHDVLVNSTGMGTLGRVACWTNREASTVDSHVTIVRFDPAKIDPVCAGFAMLDAEPEIEALGEGSTGQTELSRGQLSALRITVPSGQRSAALRPVLDALESRGTSALEESLSLAELRDVLLPKLMSGDIRVRDAEKVVEDVT